MSDQGAVNHVRPAWYADKDVQVLIYRLNRRPRPQPTLYSEDEPPPVLDHLAEVLLFGTPVVTHGRGHDRVWMLGNREINLEDGYLAGWVGYRTADDQVQDDYDDKAQAWLSSRVTAERRATAPFVIVSDSRLLFIAKHPTFAEGTLPVVFETLLNHGEDARETAVIDWSVEPMFDDPDFDRWLRATAILDSVSFHVRLPNPDAEEAFSEIVQHLEAQDAGALDHRLTPRDPDQGLKKDFDSDSISLGLMEMARRAFAQVKAKGRGANGSPRTYSQRQRVRRDPLHLPESHDGAQKAVVQHALRTSRTDRTGRPNA